MERFTSIALVAPLLLAAGCDRSDSDPQPEGPVDELAAMTEVDVRDVVAASPASVSADNACHLVGGIVRPFAIEHLHDEALTQTAGPVALLNLDLDNPVPGPGFARGTALFTAVGALDDGTVLANHHFLFEAGVVRTRDDHVSLTPTADPCVMSIDSTLFIEDGTGAYEGVGGQGHGVGSVDFCTGRGQIVWVANYCF